MIFMNINKFTISLFYVRWWKVRNVNKVIHLQMMRCKVPFCIYISFCMFFFIHFLNDWLAWHGAASHQCLPNLNKAFSKKSRFITEDVKSISLLASDEAITIRQLQSACLVFFVLRNSSKNKTNYSLYM